MDGREGMPSFYLNRGFRGPGSNAGSGNQVGGFHLPPPGFKTQPNPNIMGLPFHMEQNPHTNWNTSIGIGGGGGGGDGGGGGIRNDDDGAIVSIPNPNPNLNPNPSLSPNPGSGNESAVKKKRGRPRKYAPESSHMALGLTTVSSAEPNSPPTQKKRGRPRGSGRKQRLADVGEWMHNSAGSAFTPHIIHVAVGEDVAEKILSFAQQRQRALCILSGNGAVSALTLRQFTSTGGTVTYEGRFEILCLSGSYLLAETGSPRSRTGSLSISACNTDGQVIGGSIGGKLIASSLVQVVVCSFVYGGGDNSKAKTATDPLSGDEKSPGVELN